MTENYGIENPLEHQLKELEEKEEHFEQQERKRNKWNNFIAIQIGTQHSCRYGIPVQPNQ